MALDPTDNRWIAAIQNEAMKFVSSAQNKFTFYMGQAEHLLPDRTSFECRAQQVDCFIEALLGVTVNVVSTYLNANPDTEALVIKGVQRKFELMRKMIADAEQERAKATLKPL